jgi:putative transposase
MSASRRVSPSQLFREQLDDLFASGRELGQIPQEVGRLGVALLFQTAFEAEVTEFLGRERYARGERSQEGLRNGYSPITVKTTVWSSHGQAAQAAREPGAVRIPPARASA